MEAISAALLMALAGGAGGEAGRRAWSSLATLVRRRFRGSTDAHGGTDGTDAVPDPGETELEALAQHPDDPARAEVLLDALRARAAADADFAAELERWERCAPSFTQPGSVHNDIRGGRQYGPVIQGQHFSGLSFTVNGHAPPTDESG